MTLEQIKNDYIRDKYLASHDLDTWLDFQNFFANRHPEWFELHWEEVMKTYAMECLKRASEKTNLLCKEHDGFGHVLKESTTQSVYVSDAKISYEVNKESITNENNIIK